MGHYNSSFVEHCNSSCELIFVLIGASDNWNGEATSFKLIFVSKENFFKLHLLEDCISGTVFSQLTFTSDFLPKMERLDKVDCHCNCPLDLFLNTGSRTIGLDLCQFTNQSRLFPTKCMAEKLTFI